jgi:hypothetical protein
MKKLKRSLPLSQFVLHQLSCRSCGVPLPAQVPLPPGIEPTEAQLKQAFCPTCGEEDQRLQAKFGLGPKADEENVGHVLAAVERAKDAKE